MRPRKLSKLAIQINAVLVASCYSLVAEAATVDIPNRPLAGVALSYAPNLVLALSVEFPTGGAAYTTVGGQQKGIIKSEFLDNQYRGYFDPKKCYKYTKGQYFEPVSMAGPKNTCSGNDDFNGSIMNYLTASALDVFRQVMTGGNRAYGPNKDNKAYLDGDKINETFLRRSYKQHSSMQWRFIELNGLSEGRIRDFFPNHYVDMMPDIRARKFGPASKGMPKAYGFKRVDGKPLTDQDYFYDTKLYFSSEDFGAHALRSVKASDGSNPDVILDNMDYKAIVVKVCDPKFLEENCVAYGSNYKPEGLLQQYGRDGMRVAALGYLNDDTYAADAPVLRSRMKYLIDKENKGKAGGEEWNKTTGQFYVNPDPRDASASRVANSGVINYLNKFGDVSGYKTYDIGGELYYAALRYLRNGQSVYRRTDLNDKLKDGFPAIYDWEDPLTDGFAGGKKDKEALCRSSNIMYIGDTNTHNDWNLPKFGNGIKYKDYGNTKVPGNPPDDVIETKTYLQALLQNEGLGASTWDQNRGSSHSPAGIAGLAYWARTHDLRPDIDGDQFGNNYMIDVVEFGNFKGQNNPYWLAAKYGGFDLAKASDFNFNGTTYKMPIQRDSWTDDPVGTSSIAGFFGSSSIVGIPRNFGVANNPDNMADSLKKAFATIGSFKDPSQAAPGMTVPGDEVLDLESGATMLAASFNIGELTGDIRVVSFKTKDDGNSETKELWRVSDDLNNRYHVAGNGWKQRKVFSWNGSKGVQFNSGLVKTTIPGDASSLANYILGNIAEEGLKWRKRTSIMGTVINSSPISILPPAKEQKLNCSFSPSIYNRGTYYAVAANDGMFHVFDASKKQEIFSYIPTTALSKLEDYSALKSKHAYLNDGLSTYADVCVGSTAKSVLIGSTGRGGAAIYAMDVTDLNSVSENTVMWEFSSKDDPDLGLTIPQTAIANDSKGEPIAILSSGYNNSSDVGHLFVLNVNRKSGASWSGNYKKIRLGKAGVGTPFVYDEDKDGVPESVYVGDYDGNLWRVDYDKNANAWNVAYGGNPMFTTDAHAPITGAPFAQKAKGKLYVTVGTGQYLNAEGTTDSTQNYAYGLIDDPNNMTTISNTSLIDQTIEKRVATYETKPPRTLWHISKNPFEEGKHRGWRITLMPGQAIASNSLIRFGTLAEFVAVRRAEKDDTTASAENACKVSGSTSIISVDLRNGGEYEKSVFDTDRNRKVDDKDDVGSMITIEGVAAYTTTFTLTKSADEDNHLGSHMGIGVDGNVFDVGGRNEKDAKGAPTMIRVNLREIPL